MTPVHCHLHNLYPTELVVYITGMNINYCFVVVYLFVVFSVVEKNLIWPEESQFPNKNKTKVFPRTMRSSVFKCQIS